ncbi:AMP-dependent synthetase/ligase [Nocardioides iriomotensis]|uniref:Acyl-CoA synthetase n=1 Tax=Nocardioides iriomotensis TaxID=715784 RepID=A0A4Q5IV06_9ACTN|nr:AMP-dependent synthetase/ligase [Nocardioides iriomotensis]RYU09623.1 long-chain fatty acid--CoA ligase [Nocardioides iriomotensis]
MREYSTPLTTELPSTGNLTDDVVGRAHAAPESVAFSVARDGGWQDVTAAQFLDQVRGVAKGLMAAGVEAGERVALISRTRYEWTLLDYAIWFAGAVTVPVYETSSVEQVAWILEDSGAVAVVTETAAHADRVDQARDGAGWSEQVHDLWTLDKGAVDALVRRGESVPDADLESRRTTAGPGDAATLIYTSGTTGRPKGCVLSHGNFQFELGVALDGLPELFEGDDAATLLFLPLAHVFARVIQVGCVRAGVRLGHTAGITSLVDDLGAFQPTFVLAVPRVFEKVFNTASQRAVVDGRGGVFDRAARTAIAYSQSLDRGRTSPVLRARHLLFDRLVYARLRAALGGRCRFAVSGGAPLGERLGHFFRGVGITVLEGYGLTETTAAISVNRPAAQRIGTVGQPLGGTTIRVADDGELLVRGGQVMSRYWHDEDATREVTTAEGWLRTGDLGEIDDEGFVRVTGRKKEILVTAGGKNVAPAPLEDRVRAHHLVSQCMVVGDGRPFIAALVTLDPDAVRTWAGHRGKPTSPAALVDDPDLLAEVQQAVDEANELVSQAESIRKFRVLATDWTEEEGHLTPSLKLRRTHVSRLVRDEIDRLYPA